MLLLMVLIVLEGAALLLEDPTVVFTGLDVVGVEEPSPGPRKGCGGSSAAGFNRSPSCRSWSILRKS